MGYIWLYNYTSIYELGCTLQVPIRWAKPWDQLSKKNSKWWMASKFQSIFDAKQWCQSDWSIWTPKYERFSYWPATCVLLVDLAKSSVALCNPQNSLWGTACHWIAIELPLNCHPIRWIGEWIKLVNGWKPIRKKLTWGPPKKNLAIFLRDLTDWENEKNWHMFPELLLEHFTLLFQGFFCLRFDTPIIFEGFDCCIYDKKSHNFWLFQFLYQKVTY